MEAHDAGWRRIHRIKLTSSVKWLVGVVVGAFSGEMLARNGGEILARVEQTLSGRVPAIAATFGRSCQSLRPRYAATIRGQVGTTTTESKTGSVLLLPTRRDLLR